MPGYLSYNWGGSGGGRTKLPTPPHQQTRGQSGERWALNMKAGVYHELNMASCTIAIPKGLLIKNNTSP